MKRLFEWKNLLAPGGDDQVFDRRAHRRIPVDMAVDLRRGMHRVCSPVRAIDLSPGGLRFRSPAPLRPGELVEMVIPLPGRSPVTVVGSVTWCRGCQESWGAYEGGICFTRISAGAHIELLRAIDMAIAEWGAPQSQS